MKWRLINIATILCVLILTVFAVPCLFGESIHSAPTDEEAETIRQMGSNLAEAKQDLYVLESGLNQSLVTQFCGMMGYDDGYPEADFVDEEYQIHCYKSSGATKQSIQYPMRGEDFRDFVGGPQ